MSDVDEWCGVCPLLPGRAKREAQARCPHHGPSGPHITRADRDDLAVAAAGGPITWRARRLAGEDRREAVRLFALYDQLAAAPVAELSPLRRIPAVVTYGEA